MEAMHFCGEILLLFAQLLLLKALIFALEQI